MVSKILGKASETGMDYKTTTILSVSYSSKSLSFCHLKIVKSGGSNNACNVPSESTCNMLLESEIQGSKSFLSSCFCKNSQFWATDVRSKRNYFTNFYSLASAAECREMLSERSIRGVTILYINVA